MGTNRPERIKQELIVDNWLAEKINFKALGNSHFPHPPTVIKESNETIWKLMQLFKP